LNELQRQHERTAAQAEKIASQDQHIAVQAADIRDLEQQQASDRRQRSAELQDLKAELRAALVMLQPKDELVAER
jgi:hypothetical protein